ncbi:MAG TPA: hypothetical protein PKU78_05225, partial [Candidatus Dojkabacteria bacterium]|nr:hypothetical protein [Candidatus Dojkabacteria bacterium]
PGSEAFIADWEQGGPKKAFHGLGAGFNEMFPDNPQVLRRTLATLAGSMLWGLGVTAVLPLLAYSWDNRVSEGYIGTNPEEWSGQPIKKPKLLMTHLQEEESKVARRTNMQAEFNLKDYWGKRQQRK